MVKIDLRSTVVDAGPLIHLDELGCLDLLSSFVPLVVPSSVWGEVLTHRPNINVEAMVGCHIHQAEYDLPPKLAVMADSLGLGIGECSALSLALSEGLGMFLTDDAAARLAGESFGLRVHGTIGVVIRAIRTGARTQSNVVTLLRELPTKSTLHISRSLLDSIVRKVSEADR